MHIAYHDAVNRNLMIQRIVSGGQTGVDRGALDAAIWLGIPHGGWCPQGRRSEDGPIPECYQLMETQQRDYSVRTERNVVDSEATLVLYENELSGGTAFTVRMAKKHRKPLLVVDLNEPVDSREVLDWLINESIEVLNVAGPRESSRDGIADRARILLVDVLRDIAVG